VYGVQDVVAGTYVRHCATAGALAILLAHVATREVREVPVIAQHVGQLACVLIKAG
jgi:hypothetical protein